MPPTELDFRLAVPLARSTVAVAHRRLGPSSSATTSTDRLVPSSACHDRWASRPTTTTRLPFSDAAACSACTRHTTTA